MELLHLSAAGSDIATERLTGRPGLKDYVHNHSSSSPRNGLSSPRMSPWKKYRVFAGLILTTLVSSILIAADATNWSRSGSFYSTVVNHRASIQVAIQIIAHLLGLIHITVCCQLINFAARLRLQRRTTTLNVLQWWSDISGPRTDWNLPLRLVIASLVIALLSVIPSAIWVGATTPVKTVTTPIREVLLPAYSNVSSIKEYPSEVWEAGPTLRTTKGLFSYSVGTQLLGSLLGSAASATTPDGQERQHSKLDNTHYEYIGRSYGVGSSVGLVDDAMQDDNLATAYSYQEVGYELDAKCIYNKTSGFIIKDLGNDFQFEAYGDLPDSVGGPEASTYIGHGSGTIVAIGISFGATSPRRYLVIAAGSNYDWLNKVQCSLDFYPKLYNISVGLSGRNITVVQAGNATDPDPAKNLTRTLMRQYTLISSAQTNLYISTVGDSLNASISDYLVAHNQTPTLEEATLAGVENAITAMGDDMLIAYASAQLMVGNITQSANATVTVSAIRFGQSVYIWATLGLNIFVILLVLVEGLRTRVWCGLPDFDFMDLRSIAVASSRGGDAIADAVAGMGTRKDGSFGDVPIELRETADGVALLMKGSYRDDEAVSERQYDSAASAYDSRSLF